MKIRRASKTDVDGCLNVLKSDEDTYWKEEDLRTSVEDGRVIFLVAEEKGKVVGCYQNRIPTKWNINGFNIPSALLCPIRWFSTSSRNLWGPWISFSFSLGTPAPM
ncbi:MAG: hypothetical protein KAR39_09775 [Thermoplasmata archaeon]|nr:hypothetical protein [Thermoplasmata archaeon]